MADFNNGLAVNGPLTISDETTASVHFGAVVKAVIDDCSKHSDGGAWRKRTTSTSWYTEALGGEVWIGQQASIAAAWTAAQSLPGAVFQATATAGPLTSGKFYVATSSTTATEVFRGISRDYPDSVLWVAETGRVIGYDLTQPGSPMWMVFKSSITNSFSNFTVSAVSSLAALNGQVLIAAGANALDVINFISDVTTVNYNSGTFYWLSGVSARNTDGNRFTKTLQAIVNSTVNDVAITVLDTAPIDPATGLPVPTIAVATAGGVSVIKDDGTVVNSSHTGSITNLSIAGTLLWTNQVGGVSARLAFKELLGIAAAWSFTFVSTPDALVSGSTTTVGTGGSKSYSNNAISGSDKGVVLLKNNPATPTKGMVSYITNAYNSGWLPGDIRGAYLADTTAETITASGELVLTSDFATDTNWTKTGTATISGGVANIPADASGIYQSTATVVGRTYVYTATVVTANASLVFYVGLNGTGSQMLDTGNVTTTGAKVYTFVAQSSTSFIRAVNFSTGGVTAVIDNISVKLADADRSVKNTGLVINGSLTKAAVASGANLVAYSGFSVSNYLEQPYSANLDFGTGDFCVMGWVYNAGTDHSILHRGPIGTLSANGVFDIWTYETASQIKAVFASVQLSLSAASNTNHFVAYVRTGGVLYGYVNGVLAGSIANTNSMTLGTSDSLYIGKGYYSTGLAGGVADRLALWRISATAPSADQIAHIYRTELPLFQAGAQCTIAGTSTAVTALAYDEVADELHVGTSWGRSEFRDLLRVASEATTTGAITSLSASNSVIATGGASSAKVYAPAVNIRDLVNRKTPLVQLPVITSSLNSGPLAGFRNAVINGGFNVNQYSVFYPVTATSSNSSGLSFDRWVGQAYSGSTGSGSPSFTNQLIAFGTGQNTVEGNPRNYMRYTLSAIGTQGGTGSVYQVTTKLEDVNTLNGKLVTISFWARTDTGRTFALVPYQHYGTGGSPSAVNTAYQTTFICSTSWQKYQYTFTVPSTSGKTVGTSGTDHLGLSFVLYKQDNTVFNDTLGQVGALTVGQYLELAQVQLEQGSMATPFEQRPPQLELNLCQRYYEKSYDIGTAAGTATSTGCEFTSTNGSGLTYFVSRQRANKRATPTLRYFDVAGTVNTVSSGATNGLTVSTGGLSASANSIVVDAQFSGAGGAANAKISFQWDVFCEI